ncbi:MAG: hypothetical protein AAFX06_21400 [Planctomycetota bacterium]
MPTERKPKPEPTAARILTRTLAFSLVTAIAKLAELDDASLEQAICEAYKEGDADKISRLIVDAESRKDAAKRDAAKAKSKRGKPNNAEPKLGE